MLTLRCVNTILRRSLKLVDLSDHRLKHLRRGNLLTTTNLVVVERLHEHIQLVGQLQHLRRYNNFTIVEVRAEVQINPPVQRLGDILYLQRSFGLSLCTLFDVTGAVRQHQLVDDAFFGFRTRVAVGVRNTARCAGNLTLVHRLVPARRRDGLIPNEHFTLPLERVLRVAQSTTCHRVQPASEFFTPRLAFCKIFLSVVCPLHFTHEQLCRLTRLVSGQKLVSDLPRTRRCVWRSLHLLCQLLGLRTLLRVTLRERFAHLGVCQIRVQRLTALEDTVRLGADVERLRRLRVELVPHVPHTRVDRTHRSAAHCAAEEALDARVLVTGSVAIRVEQTVHTHAELFLTQLGATFDECVRTHRGTGFAESTGTQLGSGLTGVLRRHPTRHDVVQTGLQCGGRSCGTQYLCLAHAGQRRVALDAGHVLTLLR